MADTQYRKQVALLVRTLPLVATETCFALKGGTAINLFIRDIPRLSVDIDLAYVPIADRDTSLREIHAALHRIRELILGRVPDSRVQASALGGTEHTVKLVVRAGVGQIEWHVFGQWFEHTWNKFIPICY